MSSAFKTLAISDFTVVPYKTSKEVEYSNCESINAGIRAYKGVNTPRVTTGSLPQEAIIYNSVKNLYYTYQISASLGSGSAYDDSKQSTAAYGTYQADLRNIFPTQSGATIKVISIPQSVYGEAIAPKSFKLIGNAGEYYIVDDGNGNLIDIVDCVSKGGNLGGYTDSQIYATDFIYGCIASGSVVGNIIYNQGIAIITNSNYDCVVDAGPNTSNIYEVFLSTDVPKVISPLITTTTDCSTISAGTLELIPIPGQPFPSYVLAGGQIELLETDPLTSTEGTYYINYRVSTNACTTSNISLLAVSIINCNVIGGSVIVQPTPTPTSTPAASTTPTPTKTTTPTPTLTPTFTPSSTQTPTITPTPSTNCNVTGVRTVNPLLTTTTGTVYLAQPGTITLEAGGNGTTNSTVIGKLTLNGTTEYTVTSTGFNLGTNVISLGAGTYTYSLELQQWNFLENGQYVTIKCGGSLITPTPTATQTMTPTPTVTPAPAVPCITGTTSVTANCNNGQSGQFTLANGYTATITPNAYFNSGTGTRTATGYLLASDQSTVLESFTYTQTGTSPGVTVPSSYTIATPGTYYLIANQVDCTNGTGFMNLTLGNCSTAPLTQYNYIILCYWAEPFSGGANIKYYAYTPSNPVLTNVTLTFSLAVQTTGYGVINYNGLTATINTNNLQSSTNTTTVNYPVTSYSVSNFVATPSSFGAQVYVADGWCYTGDATCGCLRGSYGSLP